MTWMIELTVRDVIELGIVGGTETTQSPTVMPISVEHAAHADDEAVVEKAAGANDPDFKSVEHCRRRKCK